MGRRHRPAVDEMGLYPSVSSDTTSVEVEGDGSADRGAGAARDPVGTSLRVSTDRARHGFAVRASNTPSRCVLLSRRRSPIRGVSTFVGGGGHDRQVPIEVPAEGRLPGPTPWCRSAIKPIPESRPRARRSGRRRDRRRSDLARPSPGRGLTTARSAVAPIEHRSRCPPCTPRGDRGGHAKKGGRRPTPGNGPRRDHGRPRSGRPAVAYFWTSLRNSALNKGDSKHYRPVPAQRRRPQPTGSTCGRPRWRPPGPSPRRCPSRSRMSPPAAETGPLDPGPATLPRSGPPPLSSGQAADNRDVRHAGGHPRRTAADAGRPGGGPVRDRLGPRPGRLPVVAGQYEVVGAEDRPWGQQGEDAIGRSQPGVPQTGRLRMSSDRSVVDEDRRVVCGRSPGRRRLWDHPGGGPFQTGPSCAATRLVRPMSPAGAINGILWRSTVRRRPVPDSPAAARGQGRVGNRPPCRRESRLRAPPPGRRAGGGSPAHGPHPEAEPAPGDRGGHLRLRNPAVPDEVSE
jgi:hypothetical protein